MKAILSRLKSDRYTKIYSTLIILCVLITVVMAKVNANFVSLRNFANMGNQMAMTAIISFAVTNVVIGKCTDLSTGAALALSAMTGALLCQAGVPAGMCIAAMLLTGAVVGAINGLLVVYLKISPFIATFAMQQFIRGVTVCISNSKSIPVKNDALLWLGTASIGAIPVSIILVLLLCAIWWFIMNRTLYGRYVYAMGGNFEAARATGIDSQFIQFSTYLLSGLSVGIASVLYLGRVRSGQPNGGLGLEFDVLTAVFVGGALVSGGSGRPVGALLGTLLVTVIKTAMNFFGVTQFVSYIVTGCFILLAVMIYQAHMLDDIKRFFRQLKNDIAYKLSGNNKQIEDGIQKTHTIELVGITKSFGTFTALNDISTVIHSGEMVGLIGENGAGKSTMVNVLSGVFEPSQGYLKIDGEKVSFASPQDSKDKGIGVIHQHYSLIPELDIAQNLYFNQEPLKMGFVQRRKMKKQAQKLLAEFNLNIPVETKVHQLTVGQRQLIEVVKATIMNPWLLIMDEPTSSLSKTESERLYELIDQVLAKNVAIIYISHKMAEVFKICHRALVLRDGNLVGEVADLNSITEKELVNMMVGRNIENIFPYTPTVPGEIALEVEHLSDGTLLKDVSFNVRHGETVVLAGLMGAGRTESVQCIYGLRHIQSGTIKINGQVVKPKTTKMLDYQVGYVPEDRHEAGIIPKMTVAENTTLIWNRLNAKSGIISPKEEAKIAENVMTETDLKPHDPKREVITLSGGNQQKVVVGKWMAVEPKIFILDDPTRGIDVGAKSEIHEIIANYKRQGAAILIISSELPEALNVADRIYVLHNGRTVKELKHGTTEEEVMHYAFGLHLNGEVTA